MSEHNLNDMYLFAKVIEHGGFSAAGRALGMATSKLSRRVAALEQELGVRLVNRSTRSISLSGAGEDFYRHCAAMLAEAQAARDAIAQGHAEPRGLVRMACPVGLAFVDVGGIVARYMRDNAGVRVRMEATNRPVDVAEEGFDLALRATLPPLQDYAPLRVRTLASMEAVAVCSPGFVARHGQPQTLDELIALPTLSFGLGESRGLVSWPLVDRDGGATEVRHTPRFVANDLYALRSAALEGLGITMLPLPLVSQDLAQGRLVHVLPQFTQLGRIVHVVFPASRGALPAVRGLIDALVQGFARRIGPAPDLRQPGNESLPPRQR